MSAVGAMAAVAAITAVEAFACTIPTDRPEADGTLTWDSTTIVVVRITAGGRTGTGYSYTDAGAADLITRRLAPHIVGRDTSSPAACTYHLVAEVRNIGVAGIAAMAIAAVDIALWDLHARLMDLPLTRLLGQVRDAIAVYGSGGFTSYDEATLCRQLHGWAEAGLNMVKMKVGRPDDRARVRAARAAIGPGTGLFVDANGAYSRAEALAKAQGFSADAVTWFEEPVPWWDVAGLAEVRRRLPPGMELSAGEYGWTPADLKRLIDAQAIDVLQVDATRCLGITGLIEVGALCHAAGVPLSCHCAPMVHAHAACCLPAMRHIEWFHDHVRIERLLFDGCLDPRSGCLHPDQQAPGLGLTFKTADAGPYRT